MKVLLVNGSPHANGCTYTALHEVAEALHDCGVDTEIFHIGAGPMRGCIGCGACANTGRCTFDDDSLNQLVQKAKTADGFIFGAPVHYAGPAGALHSALDRLFTIMPGEMAGKPGAAVTSARRAGTTATLDVLNKYFMINNMPVVSSQYWNMVHGSTPDEVRQDKEGLQIMRQLGRNMAWMLKCIEAGRALGITFTTLEKRIYTSFIR